MKPMPGLKTHSQEPTQLAADAALPRRTPHQCMALVQGSGPHLTDEIDQVLRSRLRVACTISAVSFTSFFLWSFVRTIQGASSGPSGFDAFDQALRCLVIATLIILSALLWTSISLNRRALRIIEIVVFASMGVFFADLQFRVHYPDRLEQVATPEGLGRVLQLGNSANNTAWFFLIVLYGMFIPNTWKRCTIVVGCMALAPILMSFYVYWTSAVVGDHIWNLLVSSILFLSLSAAMAIFGSYRISELHQQAYHARKLGQYQLHRKLGSGGMGDVYLGEHVLLRRACAIKLIRSDQAGDPTTLSRFEREVQAMATLTHWNTVEVYDFGRTEEGTFYYVMEYLPGLSLQELIDLHGGLPPGRIIYFLRQICAALQEAHAIGLIHRDIKPSNIIICRRGAAHDVAKLLDFGLVHEIGPFAEGAEKLTMQGTILGSPNFLSPEQARGKGEIDARTDIYSLGALAYFLVTGRPPFVRETVMDLLTAHMRDDPAPLRQERPETPSDLEEIILTCLRKNPDERFANVESLDRALAACEAAGQWDKDQARNWWRRTECAVTAAVAG